MDQNSLLNGLSLLLLNERLNALEDFFVAYVRSELDNQRADAIQRELYSSFYERVLTLKKSLSPEILKNPAVQTLLQETLKRCSDSIDDLS